MTTPASAPEPTPAHPTAEHRLAAVPDLTTLPEADSLGILLDTSPAAFLSCASYFTGIHPWFVEALAGQVDFKTKRPVRALAAAGSYFLRFRTIDIVGIDLPNWLTHLDDSRTARVKRRPHGRWWDWLVEAILPGGHPLAAHLVVEPGVGAIDDARVFDGTARDIEDVVARGGPAAPAFMAVDLPEAATRLVDALGRYRASIGDPQPGSAWPANEALVTWLIATLLHDAGAPERAA